MMFVAGREHRWVSVISEPSDTKGVPVLHRGLGQSVDHQVRRRTASRIQGGGIQTSFMGSNRRQ